MASEAKDVTCPVCQVAPKEPSYVLACLHRFCFGCIMRWAKRSSTCPLCRQRITSIRYSIWAEDDFLEVQLAPDAEAQADSQQDEQGAAEPVPQPAVGGLVPEEWAALFREHLGPLRSWVRQQARELFDAAWWDQDMLEATVIAWLCRCGLDEQALVQELRPLLQGHTVSFVQRLISIMLQTCSEEYLEDLGFLEPRPASQLYNGPEVDLEGSQDTWEPELKGSQDTWEPEESPEAIPSTAASPRDTPASSPEDSDVEELPSTSSAALPGGPGHLPTTPIPGDQEEPFSEPRQAAEEDAVVPGCSHEPSPPGQGRDSSPGGPRQRRKRRADSNLDSPQPCKRPPRL
ncbi:MOB kinase activator 3B isoform X1 [Anas platyrhynchos]|uniref:MOB kinase activator 3B isoform X1 n=1 Tax=Anas platyrhynchos TaxID=8839 RepID=UPI003AF1FCC4